MIVLLLFIFVLQYFVIFVLQINFMELDIRIKMNEKLFLRNPEESALGKKIVKHGLLLINKLGFEDFTFKKLAADVNTTEASIYRYFENKHRLLVYIITWYYSYLEYKVVFSLNNISDPKIKLQSILKLIAEEPIANNLNFEFLSEADAYQLVIWEGSKTYLSRNIGKDNKDRLFKPYKDLCERFSLIIKEYNPKYKYPHSLASSIMEIAHSQSFFKQNLPSLTDFPKETDNKKLIDFITVLLFSSLDSK